MDAGSSGDTAPYKNKNGCDRNRHFGGPRFSAFFSPDYRR